MKVANVGYVFFLHCCKFHIPQESKKAFYCFDEVQKLLTVYQSEKPGITYPMMSCGWLICPELPERSLILCIIKSQSVHHLLVFMQFTHLKMVLSHHLRSKTIKQSFLSLCLVNSSSSLSFSYLKFV